MVAALPTELLLSYSSPFFGLDVMGGSSMMEVEFVSFLVLVVVFFGKQHMVVLAPSMVATPDRYLLEYI